jgi:hypothetical protein
MRNEDLLQMIARRLQQYDREHGCQPLGFRVNPLFMLEIENTLRRHHADKSDLTLAGLPVIPDPNVKYGQIEYLENKLLTSVADWRKSGTLNL